MKPALRLLTLTVACWAAAAVLGCGQRSEELFPRQPTFPVRGKLMMRGTGIGGAQLTFNPVGVADWKGPFPTADTEADGSFVVRTYELDDGAPAGAYAVTVVWPLASEEDEPRDRLGERYAGVSPYSPRVQILQKATQLPPINLP